MHLPACLQGQLLLLATEFMPGGNLRVALQQPEMRQQLRWKARWVRDCAWSAALHAPAVLASVLLLPAIVYIAYCICCCRGRQVALDIAEALDYLHNEPKVLHGDLKPG